MPWEQHPIRKSKPLFPHRFGDPLTDIVKRGEGLVAVQRQRKVVVELERVGIAVGRAELLLNPAHHCPAVRAELDAKRLPFGSRQVQPTGLREAEGIPIFRHHLPARKGLRERGFANRRWPLDDADHILAFTLHKNGPEGSP